MDPLGELIDILSTEDSPAALERVDTILRQCPPWISADDAPAGSSGAVAPTLQEQIDAVLGLVRYLGVARGRFHDKMLPTALEFLRVFPTLVRSNYLPLSFTPQASVLYFKRFFASLSDLVVACPDTQQQVSAAVAAAVTDLAEGSRTASSSGLESDTSASGNPYAAVLQLQYSRAFLSALGDQCPDLLPQDADKVAIFLFEQYIQTPPSQLLTTTPKSLPSPLPLANGTANGEVAAIVPSPQGTARPPKGSGAAPSGSGYGVQRPIPSAGSPSPATVQNGDSSSTTGAYADVREAWEKRVADNGEELVRTNSMKSPGKGMLQLSPAQDEGRGGGEGGGVGEEVGKVTSSSSSSSDPQLHKDTGVLLDSVDALQSRQLAFSVFAQLLRQRRRLPPGSKVGVQRPACLAEFSAVAGKQLKAVVPLLMLRKRDTPEEELPSRSEAVAKFRASEAAATVESLCSSIKELDGKVHKGTVREAASLLMDAADACVQSAWRRVSACEELLDALVSGAADVAVAQGGQAMQVVLLRMKALLLIACTQPHAWTPGEEPCAMLQSLMRACDTIVRGGWESDRAAMEVFLTSTAAYMREQPDLMDRNRAMVAMMLRQNVAPVIARMTVSLNQPAATQAILPIFLESLEEGATSLPAPLRLRVLEAIAMIASLGHLVPYREVVVLLTRAYIDSLSTSYEGVEDEEQPLPRAFLLLARNLKDPDLRTDLRQRLLSLCSDAGLLVESQNSRCGAAALGNLLPAVAAVCSEMSPTDAVEPPVLKLFRNLWFYIVLYGLAPPLPGAAFTQRVQAALSSSVGGSMNGASTTSLQAVAGPYKWRADWMEAVHMIAQKTPPLVMGSVKWLEDEVELNSLHNPGSQRGSASEKAAALQRTALSSALGGRIDTPAMSTISGVKATYLLSVAALEILRMAGPGGIIQPRDAPPGTIAKSALSCVFQYLELPSMAPGVSQCLTAIVHRTFDAAVLYAGAPSNSTEEREAALEAHACFLISAETHRLDAVRELADSLLSTLRNKFSQVLWNSRCLDALLVLVADPPPPAPTSDPQAVQAQRSALLRRVREWITYGLLLAPSTMQGLLQEKLRKFNTWHKQAHTSDLMSLVSEIRLDPSQAAGWSASPLGIVPAAAAAAAAAAGGAPTMGEKGAMEVLSTGMISANAKSLVAGEIAGMKRLFSGVGGLMTSSAFLGNGGILSHTLSNGKPNGGHLVGSGAAAQGDDVLLNNMLMEKLVQVLQHFVVQAEKGLPIDEAGFREASLRATALLLSENAQSRTTNPEGFSRLLRLLCWCPGYIFTPEAVETGVFVWTWLLSAAPALGATILAELADSWLWTRDCERGLFSRAAADGGEMADLRPQLAPGPPVKRRDGEDPMRSIVAHRIWLGFLLDRFEVARYSSKEQVRLIGRLLEGSLEEPSRLTTHPGAAGAVFTLHLLGLLFCHTQLEPASTLPTQGSRVTLRILRDRVHRAALAWFAVRPGRHDPRDEGACQGEAQTLAAFTKVLAVDEKIEARVSDALARPNGGGNSGSGHSTPTSRASLMTRSTPDYKHPIWGSMVMDNVLMREKRRQLLLILCQNETDRLETWAAPLRQDLPVRVKPAVITAEKWTDLVRTAWSVDPRIAIGLTSRFPTVMAIRTEVTSLVQNHVNDLADIPEALPFFVTPAAVEKDSPVLQLLPYWAPCSIVQALDFLTPPYKGHPRVMAHVLRVLQSYPPEKVTFFMPQLVQALRYDHKGLVRGYLMSAAQRSNLFAHILIWQLQGEEAPPEDEKAAIEKKHGPMPPNKLWEIVPGVRQSIIDSFSDDARVAYEREFKFFDAVTSISGALKPLPKEERRAGIKTELASIHVEGDDIYLPTAPTKLVRDIVRDSGIPLQSAAKVPIMITFEVVEKEGDPNDIKPQACIFKVGDDCRQDVLALQVISLLRDIYNAIGLDIYLFPYGVLPTGYERGIIEVVPNSRSRNQMGEITDGGLYEIFQQEYGPPGSPKFEAARHNFIVSSAGYAVASLLLQPKDRHNGNLLVDRDGRLIHIDFGFILETSPGGNMRFESADFKLSHEMTQLLDPSGVMKSETWYLFVSLCVKGYLAARQHYEGIVSIVQLMMDSGLPCFSRGEPIKNLRNRFHPEMGDREAANFMIYTCTDAYNKWSTAGYDLIQYLQQGIEK